MYETEAGWTERVDWGNFLFISFYHLALFISLPLYLSFYTPSWGLIAATGVIYILGGIGITAGYHRYYAHKAFSPSAWFEPILLLMGTLSVQGDVLKWACAHRRHHNHVDGEQDPYSIEKGFWYAHILWILEDSETKKFRPEEVPDLVDNTLLQIQRRFYVPLMILVNAAVVGLVGWWTGDIAGAIVFVFLLRLCFTHHSTWFINSLAHTWGEQPFSREHSAVNNFIISLLSFGEGYHNFHHTFPCDYRNGVRWYQIDITKYFIWLLEKAGLVEQKTKTSDFIIQKKLIVEDQRYLLKRIQHIGDGQRKKWKRQIEDKAQSLKGKLVAAWNLMKKRQELRELDEQSKALVKISDQLQELRTNIRSDFEEWWRFSNRIEKQTPATV